MTPPVVIKPGVVFWPKGGPDDPVHPYIVLSTPVDGNVLVVNFSGLEHNPDADCVVKRTELPLTLKKDSYVFFAKTTEIPCRKMPQLLAEETLVTRYPDLPAEILSRVMNAAKKSAEISEALKIKYGLIPKKSGMPF